MTTRMTAGKWSSLFMVRGFGNARVLARTAGQR